MDEAQPEVIDELDWLKLEKFQLQLANLQLQYEAYQRSLADKYSLKGATIDPSTRVIKRGS